MKKPKVDQDKENYAPKGRIGERKRMREIEFIEETDEEIDAILDMGWATDPLSEEESID